jgi:hypothetical protein
MRPVLIGWRGNQVPPRSAVSSPATLQRGKRSRSGQPRGRNQRTGAAINRISGTVLLSASAQAGVGRRHFGEGYTDDPPAGSMTLRSSGFDAFHGVDLVDRSVERGDATDAGALGAGNEVRLGEVEAIVLVDLDRAEQQRRVHGDH